MPKRGDSANYALEPPQVVKLMAACSTLEEKVTIGCQLYLGLRISELAHMKATWLTGDGNLRIPSFQKCYCTSCFKHRNSEWRPKTKSGARTLPIPGTIKHEVLKFLALQPEGFQLSRISLYHDTKAILHRAGIKTRGLAQNVASPHILRATCLTMLASGGMSVAALAYFAGWANISIASHYINLAQAKSAAEKEAKIIFGA